MCNQFFYIQWHITDKCNLRCMHCYQDDFTSKSELTLEELKKVCDNVISTLKKWDKKLKVAITGGEPFLNKNLVPFVSYLDKSEQVSEISFISNGTFIDKYIPFLNEINKLDTIFISLDGTTFSMNDAIRGKGVYGKAIKNIELLKSEGFKMILMFTVMKKNFNDAKLLYDFIRLRRIDGYIIERFIPLGLSKKIKDEIVSGRQIRELYEHTFNQCNVEFNDKEMCKYRALQVRLTQSVKLYGAECVAGRDGIAILPDGTVLPCRRFYLPIGNLLKQSLDQIRSSSSVLKDICDKNKLDGKCGKCEISDCYGCRAIAFAMTGNYLAEDPQCFYL